ncbi:MAG: alpha-1,2-fucosyltransferase [Clostridioides sp.]|jgi:hypothetical protein|nr:alpha-1,2-fucosyltransferase [Clostridioides sp.]
MNIIIFTGGLGNQMSQYAFAVAKSKHARTIVSTYFLQRHYEHQGYELKRLFDISIRTNPLIDFSVRIIRKLIYLRDHHLVGNVACLLLRLLKILNCNVWMDDGGTKFDYEFLKNKSGLNFYLGGWLSEKYYYDIQPQSLFKFRFEDLNIKSKEILNSITTLNSVSIHIRRGDYQIDYNKDTFGSVCNFDYYSNAIEYINKHTIAPVFFCFSDEIEYAKHFLNINQNVFYIDWNKNEDSWQDMCLISKCKHNINANSTFSWWGAYLNSNPQKIVIVPSHYTSNKDIPVIYPETWIKI